MSSGDVFNSKDYKRSRSAYCLESAFEYFVALLVADAFLAKLLSELGLSDGTIGIIASFISFAFLFQLCAIFMVQRITNTKRTAILFHTVSQLLFMSLYLIPFLPFAQAYKQIIVIVCILFAYFGNYCVTSIIYKWGNSYVDPHKRASYSAGKEMISLVSGMVVTVTIGAVMDHFDATNNTAGGFIFAAIAIFIFCACDFVCLILIKNQIKTREELKLERVPMSEVMRNTLGNKNFRSIIYLQVLWNFAQYFIVGFLGTYRLSELCFTLGAVQIINLVGTAGRFFLSKPFGRYSDKRSYAKGIELALTIAVCAFAIGMFTSPTTRFLIIGYTLLYNICLAGIHQNLNNITYSYVDSKYFVQASAIKNSIGGLCGFVAALLASRLLTSVQNNGNSVFGITVYGQQILFGVSLILAIAALVYTKLVISRQKVMIQ
jgi:MFS family permease